MIETENGFMRLYENNYEYTWVDCFYTIQQSTPEHYMTFTGAMDPEKVTWESDYTVSAGKPWYKRLWNKVFK